MDKKKLKYLYDVVKQTLSLKRTKFTLYIVVVLWLAAGTQIIVNRMFYDNFHITQAFVKANTTGQQSSIEIIAEYKKDFLSEQDKKDMIKHLADSIGLTIDGEISVIRDGARSEYSYGKQAKSASTMIKVVSLEQQLEAGVRMSHFIVVRLSILQSIQSIDGYKARLEAALKELDIEDKQVTMQYEGSIDGEITTEEKERLANLLISELQGEVALQYEEEGIYTVYAYTGLLKEYIVSAGSKVNIHVAITYNEKDDKTRIYLATPILNQSW